MKEVKQKQQSPTEKIHILIIEDDQSQLDLLLQFMGTFSLPTQIYTRTDGRSGLAFFEESKEEKLNLVILDLNLPGVHGLDILKAMRSIPKYESMPVIVLTGSEEKNDLLETYRIGGAVFVRKPYKIEDIFTAILNFRTQGRL